MERFIFDLDGTLLEGDFYKEDEYFKSVLSKEDFDKFLAVKMSLLYEYEELYPYYDINLLSRFLSINTGIEITKKMISDWIEVNMQTPDKIEEGATEVLEYLKSKNKSIVVCTNWFLKGQKQRLKNMNLLDYFDEIYSGDMHTKPHKEAYINACGIYNPKDCIMIGDSYEKDYYQPKQVGLNALLYHKGDDLKESNDVIKSLKKIKEMY